MKRMLSVLLLCSSFSWAQNIRLSDQAEISVITCGPSQGQVFTAFGHSAFRVYDPVNRIDDAYNYGVFDYDKPYFYLDFARGQNYYKLGVQDYQRFESAYIYYNRYLHEQVLNLTSSQKQKLYAYLEWNALPENQYYLYDYFYDNCATKLPEIIVEVFGDSIAFDGSYIASDYTIRELTDIYLKYQPWGDLGIDICLGLPMDKKASPYEYMFLPDYVESGFDHAAIQNAEGSFVPLVKGKRNIYESRDEEMPGGLPHPMYVFAVVAMVVTAITAWDLKRKSISTWLDAVLFGTIGIIGLTLLLLWFATDHKAAAYNYNLLWALPTHLIAVIAFVKQPPWLEKYFLITLIITVLLLASWLWIPQKLNYSLIPLVMALGVRMFAQYRLRSVRRKVN
jgi:hypothetical protein